MKYRCAFAGGAIVAAVLATGLVNAPIAARTPSAGSGQARSAKPVPAQKIDEEYTRIIKQNLQDPRITTELVDHLPASDTVPSPLKFLGRAVGTTGELTYAKDIYRYYEALAKAAPNRAKYWKVGPIRVRPPRRARSSSCTPRSRSTTRSAACIRRRPAGPRC